MARRSPERSTSGKRASTRCAIYTRKSSEEGLEQAFNSLDAQREACEAFVLSQKHEGWSVLPDMYDDGGFSGGSMERPALKRLLSDIAAGRIDVVVVYKVDRLTRSLSDFARIVEILDQRSISFVSVTQQFNTTTSMGRLTLNVLLSFAQFEREVTGERIRDKIAASKKKGMWMGGNPPLGYDPKDRKLVVNEAEADTVRHIFRRYAELKSVRLLKAELDAIGTVSKPRTDRNGSAFGGKPFSRGALYLMLQNRIYRGEIVHKDQSFAGEHAAIVDQGLWDEAQTILADNRVERDSGNNSDEPSLLAGLLLDATGERMTPSHAVKRGVRYRYYVSRRLVTGGAEDAGTGQRIPAVQVEALVSSRIHAWLSNPASLLNSIGQALSAADQRQVADAAAKCAAGWMQQSPEQFRSILRAIIEAVQVHPDRIEIALSPEAVVAWLKGVRLNTSPAESEPDHAREPVVLVVPAELKRAGMEMRLVLAGSEQTSADAGLTRLLVRAWAIRDRLLQDSSITLAEIATTENVVASYATRLLRLTFLAPDITAAILDGGQPPSLTATKLMGDTRLPLDWREQRQVLSFT